MPVFSKLSRSRLESCDRRLQLICHDVIGLYDFTVLEGCRTKEEQNRLFREGKSKLEYPNSKHNNIPSKAVDITPYPIDWRDRERFYLLAGMMFKSAHQHGIKIRWGGDWDGDWKHNDQSFDDLVHFELID